jgi:hypothetical protein
MNQNDNRSQEVGQGWREDGRVDIDAVRTGAHDVNDTPAVFESLCDEVEQLRAEVENCSADRDLMRAVLESIDLPYPATSGDEGPYLRMLERRAMLVTNALRMAFEDDYNVPVMAQSVRKRSADMSVTYKTSGGAR